MLSSDLVKSFGKGLKQPPPFMVVAFLPSNRYWCARFATCYEFACDMVQREFRRYETMIFEWQELAYVLVRRDIFDDIR